MCLLFYGKKLNGRFGRPSTFLGGQQDKRMLPRELETGKVFVISRKPERTKGSVFSCRKKKADVRNSSAYLWQGLREGQGRVESAKSPDS